MFIVILPIIGFGAWRYGDKLWHLFYEIYGPDVVIGVLPATLTHDTYGDPDLLYEFTFRRGMVVRLAKSADVERLARHGTPVTIRRFICPGDARPGAGDLYKLSLIMHNLGDRTAEQYQLTISFSGPDLRHRDPGVRIVHIETDDLRVGYVYQQEPRILRPACIGDELKAAGASPLSRQTYQELGLTRDLAIVSGTLPAHVFQIADLIVKVPRPTERFVVLFHVQCPNCRMFYKTISVGQLVAVAKD